MTRRKFVSYPVVFNKVKNIYTDSIKKEKINVFSYENKERYEELIITEKKFIQTKGGSKTLKTLIKKKILLLDFTEM